MVSRGPKMCARCGAIYIPTGACQKFCTECQHEAHKERCRRYNKAHRIYKGRNQRGENNNNWQGGIGIYKELAFQLYGKVCRDCGSTKHLCVHHLDESRRNNDPKNLVVLCRSCHAKRHFLHQNFAAPRRYSQPPQ